MKDEAGWGHIEPNYTLQTYMGSRFLTAAVRCTKYYAEDYGYSTEKYGIFGFSKSSWVALFKNADIATIDPDALEEIYTYGGFEKGECFGDQPFQTYRNGQTISSGVTCVYHGMGNGTNECRDLAENNIPQLVGVGEKCEYNSWEKFFKTKDVLGNMDRSGCDWVPLIMYGVNHTWPKNVEDKLYGYNYYSAFMSFFAYHLKGESASILHTSVNLDGEVSEDDGIFVQFMAALDAKSALKLLDADGNVVEIIAMENVVIEDGYYVFETDTLAGTYGIVTKDSNVGLIIGVTIGALAVIGGVAFGVVKVVSMRRRDLEDDE
jgi:hypothetical protein